MKIKRICSIPEFTIFYIKCLTFYTIGQPQDFAQEKLGEGENHTLRFRNKHLQIHFYTHKLTTF